jgi:ATP-binding cassette subfamily B protein
MMESEDDSSSNLFHSDLVEELPESIIDSLRRIELKGRVRLAASGDIDSRNRYGETWLVLADEQLLVFEPAVSSDPIIRVPVRDLRKVELRRYVGNNALIAKTRDREFELLRFTNTLRPRFEALKKRLEAILNLSWSPALRETQLTEREFKAQRRCPKCGRVIPPWMSTCPVCMSKRKVIFRLLGYVRPHMPLAILGFALTVFFTFLNLLPPYLMKVLIDDAIGNANLTLLVWLTVSLAGIYLLRALTAAGRSYLLGKLGQRIMYDLRRRLYEHLQVLSLSFYDKNETGRIMSRVMSDTERVQFFITWGIQQFIMDTLILIFVTVILFTMNWQLAIIVLMPTPVLIIGTRLFSKKIHNVYHKAWRRWADLSAILADTVPGVTVVKAFSQERKEISKFNRKTRELYEVNVKISFLEGIFFPLVGFVMTLGAVSVWWFGGRQILSGELTLGVLTAFISYTWSFYEPVGRLSNMSSILMRATTSAERIFEVLDTRPEVHDSSTAVSLPPLKGHIKFHNVSFAYESGETVLRNINLEIKPGQKIGLVGPSGAGKTTLAKLILRFYDPTEGKITIDGYDLREVKQESLRRQIGIVLQEPFLFKGSIAENIAYGNPRAPPEKIIEAAKAANIHDFILSLPEAYDTDVGERGHRLSGGEKQRVSIARALLRDPRILILDEATSSVDTATESLIQQALERLMENRTSIIIAHRLSTLRNSDKIVVIDNGEIIEEGTHEELLRLGGLYSRLCRMQAALTVIAER